MTLIDRLIRASSPQGHIGSRLIALVFGALFGASGIAVLWSTCLFPVTKSASAQDWPVVAATILESGLTPDQENVIIKYEYTLNQQIYQGDTYSYTDISRNFARASFHQAIAKHPENSIKLVRYNPGNHKESILDPSIHPIAWMGIFFSVPFITVGICGITWALAGGWITKRNRILREEAAQSADQRGAHHIANCLRNDSPAKDETVIFLDGQDRLNAMGLLAVCLFWNGIVSVFLFVSFLMFLSGSVVVWLLAFFLLPFVFIGLILSREMAHRFFFAQAPNYVFVASPTAPVVSSMKVNLHWFFLGDSRDGHRIQKFNFLVSRGAGMGSFAPFKRKEKLKNKLTELVNLAALPEEKFTGQRRFELPAVSLKSYFFGSVKQPYQGSVDLLVTWKMRGQKQSLRDYTLDQTDND